MSDLADRYGARTRRSRVPLVLAVVLSLAFGAWLTWSTLSYADPAVQSELTGWEVTGEHQVRARVDVMLRDDEVVASCLVRAYAGDHSVVGEEAFEVTGSAAGPVEVEVRTERRATAVEQVGCTAPDQPRPR